MYVEESYDRKSKGTASRSWEWYWVFPSENKSIDPRDQEEKRHHIVVGGVSNWIKRVVKKAGIEKRVTAHTFRHSYATHLLMNGVDIRTIQEALGHNSVKTTEVYLHVMQALSGKAESPLDSL